MSEPRSERGSGKLKRRAISVGKLAFALLLLAWVAKGLAWRDVLVWHEGESSLTVEGQIFGEWGAMAIDFHIDDDAPALSEAWPQELREARSRGEQVSVQRRDLSNDDAAGYDWRPGLPRVLMGLSAGGLALAFVALLAGLVMGVTRWWRLLALARCPSSWLNTLRLTFLGLFFNLVFPGLTGGDVPKALLVVREHPERRADAMATVVIDRLVGLWGLIGIATAVSLAGGAQFAPLKLPIACAFLAATTGMIGLLFPGLRRLLRVDALIEKLPQARRVKKLERAALVYTGHPLELALAILLSVGNHLAVITAIYFLGRDLGSGLDYAAYFGVVPVANVISSLPISPSGWGVGEAAYGQLFELMGETLALGVAVSLAFRLCNVCLSLVGGLCLLLPGGGSRAEVQRLAQEELGQQLEVGQPEE